MEVEDWDVLGERGITHEIKQRLEQHLQRQGQLQEHQHMKVERKMQTNTSTTKTCVSVADLRYHIGTPVLHAHNNSDYQDTRRGVPGLTTKSISLQDTL